MNIFHFLEGDKWGMGSKGMLGGMWRDSVADYHGTFDRELGKLHAQLPIEVSLQFAPEQSDLWAVVTMDPARPRFIERLTEAVKSKQMATSGNTTEFDEAAFIQRLIRGDNRSRSEETRGGGHAEGRG